MFDAPIDTTFAVYRPTFMRFELAVPSIRTGHPYIARHLPWYADMSRPTEEDLFYRARLRRDLNHWNTPRLSREIAQQMRRSRPAYRALESLSLRRRAGRARRALTGRR